MSWAADEIFARLRESADRDFGVGVVPDAALRLSEEFLLRFNASSQKRQLVVIESPYAGDIAKNERYARAALHDSLMRGEAPLASHLLYTQPGVLDDRIACERQAGIEAGLTWGRVADKSVVYTDLGISRGMQYGISAAGDVGRPVEYRTIGGWHD